MIKFIEMLEEIIIDKKNIFLGSNFDVFKWEV